MTKTELINKVAEQTGATKKSVGEALDAFLEAIQDALVNGDKVTITGFGTFEVRERGEKTVVNPQTKKKMVVPPSKAPAFKAGRALKDAVNK
ncbi:MAG: HU family DNA-binding protein [Ruminococcus sp.]|nr:HU family DNA-binding protein [Ruminococcus sp.]